MDTRVTQGLQVLRRTAAFLAVESVPARMGPISKHVEALNGVIARLTTLAAEQKTSGRAFSDASRKAREQARALVREYARPLARQGKLMFPVDSELRVSLKLPSGTVAYEEVIATVKGFTDRVEEHPIQEVARGAGNQQPDGHAYPHGHGDRHSNAKSDGHAYSDCDTDANTVANAATGLHD